MKKAIVILIFFVVTLGFIWGFISYNRSLSAMMNQEITEEMPFVNGEVKPETTVETPNGDVNQVESPVEMGQEKKDKIVPSIFGLTQLEAEKLLSEEGFLYQVYFEVKENTMVDTVFYQRPKPGDVVPGDEVIHFSVSQKIEEKPVTEEVKMPDLTGKSEREAKANLQSLGLEMRSRQVDSSKEKGTVVIQSENYGSLVKKGSTITVSISKGPVEVTPSPTLDGNPEGETVPSEGTEAPGIPESPSDGN